MPTNPLPNSRLWFTPMFSFKSFMVLLHLGLLSILSFFFFFFFYVVWGKSTASLFSCSYPVFPALFVKKIILSPSNGRMALVLVLKSVNHRQIGLFMDCQFYFLCLSLCQYHTVALNQAVTNITPLSVYCYDNTMLLLLLLLCSEFTNQKVGVFWLLFFFTFVLTILSPIFHMNFSICFSVSTKKTARILVRIALNL